MSTGRYFTVEEANALLPALEVRFTRILQLRARMQAAQEQLQSLGEAAGIGDVEVDDEPDVEEIEPDELHLMGDTGAEVIALPPDEVRSLRGRLRGLALALTEDVRAIESWGVAIKDLDIGLCDFLALREGREVWLCWKLGEKRITHWHDLSSGFAGRQPLDDDEGRRTRPRVLH